MDELDDKMKKTTSKRVYIWSVVWTIITIITAIILLMFG